MVDKTGFLCDERLKDLLYIRDDNEKPKESPVESTPKEEEKPKVTPAKKEKPIKDKTPSPVNLDTNPIEINSEPLSDLNDLDAFESFSGFDFREPGSKPVEKTETSIDTDAIFGDFKAEDEIPLMDDLDDIAASILSDIYGGVY